MIPIFAHRALHGQPLVIYGDGELSPDEQRGLALYLEELREDGSVEFEGDPGLEWFTAHSGADAERVIFLGAGEVCVASSTHIETQTPSLTFRRLEKPAEPGSLLTPDVHEVDKFLSIVVVATRPAAQVLYAAAKAVLARFPAVEGEKANAAQGVADLLSERERLRSLLQQMLDVAENADETGYVTDVGFVDLGKLHAKVRVALAAGQPFNPAEVIESQKQAHSTPLQLD